VAASILAGSVRLRQKLPMWPVPQLRDIRTGPFPGAIITMRTRADILAMKFWYGNNTRRKHDRIAGSWNSTWSCTIWRYNGEPIAILLLSKTGRFLKLTAKKMSKSIAERFNAALRMCEYKETRIEPDHTKWRTSWCIVTEKEDEIKSILPWTGSFTLKVSPGLQEPVDKLLPPVDRRLEQLAYGKDW
jgi:hypothetical protein